MTALITIDSLSEAIAQATRSAKFCVSGCFADIDPGIEVDGLGAVRIPLKRGMAKELVAQCQTAPYGKGTQTLVDTKVRNTFELDPKKFRLSEEWNAAVAAAARVAAGELGLPAERVEARLYKLLVYEKGGFFLMHRDSEKHHGMVASMIFVLRNPFEGGLLVVRHGAASQTLAFEQAAQGKATCYAAFYADCEHEVKRVTRGVRLCLTYNLVLQPKGGKSESGGQPATEIDRLTEAITSWVATRPAKPLVFALEHHYTERGLSLDLLKGADRQLAELVVPAAENADCLVHLAQVSRHLLQYADDGSYGGGYYRGYSRPRRIEIGETYEDDLKGVEWTGANGKKQAWGEMALDPSAIVSSIPLDQWKPTSEQYTGYTGNEGNSLDRWYHRSAIVLWHRDHHFDVVASCGLAVSIPLFEGMMKKLAKTPKKRLEAARSDCVRFARAIVAQWPTSHIGYWRDESKEPSPHDDFPDLLLSLHDRDTIALFLATMAQRDPTRRLEKFIVAACREFGWSAFARELKQLIAKPTSEQQRQDASLRDFEWLSAFCLDKTVDPDRVALANELCPLAVERFCVSRSSQPSIYWQSPWYVRSGLESSLPLLLRALIASGRDEDLSRVIDFVESQPDPFSLDHWQVPTLKEVVPWSRERLGSVPPRLLSWLGAVRDKLQAATAKPPAPPVDWARPADVSCTCAYCAQLNAFLANPANEVGRIPAREDIRHHLTSMIDRHQCDVKYAVERKGSPHSLVLTKTNGSFQRATKRFNEDRRLLEVIDKVGGAIAPRQGQ